MQELSRRGGQFNWPPNEGMPWISVKGQLYLLIRARWSGCVAGRFYQDSGLFVKAFTLTLGTILAKLRSVSSTALHP